MKKFNIPEYYKSPIIGKVKAKRKLEDPRKKDFSPSSIKTENLEFIISRHFGFCFGVENAIEKSYMTIQNNPDKTIFLLSQMIHNPEVNEDLASQGVQFIQDTEGNQLIPWSQIEQNDIVIIPAFGTTIETLEILKSKNIDIVSYNTTCPFVEKVWNRSTSLGKNDYTVIIHGKHSHEETKATFSHSELNAPSIIVRDLNEAKIIGDFIAGKNGKDIIFEKFKGKYSRGFDPSKDLQKIGVVNQTTMLASETQEIAEMLKQVMNSKHSNTAFKTYFADTRDTLCYATNDNQTATIELLKSDADLAIVVGGYNSSNTTHLVELLSDRFTTYFIQNENEILNKNEIRTFDINVKKIKLIKSFLPHKKQLKIIITSGASCPDSILDRVMQKISFILGEKFNPQDISL